MVRGTGSASLRHSTWNILRSGATQVVDFGTSHIVGGNMPLQQVSINEELWSVNAIWPVLV